MGVNNRQRRRAKKQKRQRDDRARNGHARPSPRTGAAEFNVRHDRGHDEDLARATVLAAAEAFRFDPEPVYRQHLDALRALEAGRGRPLVEHAISWWVERALDRAWASGWQPADVVRALRRELSVAHAAALASAVAESGARRPEAATDDRWAAQVDSIRAECAAARLHAGWSGAALPVEAVSLLLHVPPLPNVSTTSGRKGRTGRGRSGAVLERVRALLAKAESTTFPEEAEALTAKAQQLMARHAIDRAMLDAGSSAVPTEVVAWRIGVEEPYVAAKSYLLDRIASACGCHSVWSKHLGFSTVFGTRVDLEMVEILFTSLLVQGTDAMLRAGRASDRSGRSRTRSFRQSFLLAYAQRVGERLSATAAQAVGEGAERHGDALLPVLAGRAEAVQAAVRAAFPQLAERGMSINNYSGWAAGRAAAETVSLTAGDELAAG